MSDNRFYDFSNDVGCCGNNGWLKPNVYSDFSVFEAPIYNYSGTTNITCQFESLDLTINYSSLYHSVLVSCPNAADCSAEIDWIFSVAEDSVLVYTSTTITTIQLTGETISDTILQNAANEAFDALGYEYLSFGNQYFIEKPTSATTLTIGLCFDIRLLSGGTCPGGRCSYHCYAIDSVTYNSINSGSTGVYILTDTALDIPLTIEFSAQTIPQFSGDTNLNFHFDIYKYNSPRRKFIKSKVFTSETLLWNNPITQAITSHTETINSSVIGGEGEYSVRASYSYDVDTQFRKLSGDKLSSSRTETQYGLYEPNVDGYFIVVRHADEPKFRVGSASDPSFTSFRVSSILITSGNTGTTYNLGSGISGDLIVDLNGISLSVNGDYTISGVTDIQLGSMTGKNYAVITLATPTVSGDVLTFAYSSSSDIKTLKMDSVVISTPIVSGATNGQGSNVIYYNTDTNKYEAYTSITPIDGSDVYITLNGYTLANRIDYYRSTSNSKRVIFEGLILVGDTLNMSYHPRTVITDELYSKTHNITWYINNRPIENNGEFILQVSDDDNFTSITYSAATNYVIGVDTYTLTAEFSGNVNDMKYYRVINNKNYVTICGDVISTSAVSEVIPTQIMVASINNY